MCANDIDLAKLFKDKTKIARKKREAEKEQFVNKKVIKEKEVQNQEKKKEKKVTEDAVKTGEMINKISEAIYKKKDERSSLDE